jgi:putative peptidoglycan lipid II flippase
MGERFVPILAGMAVSQLYLFVEKIFAGGLGDQKISALWLAFSVVQLPIAIFSGSLAVPLFPLLSEYAKRNEMDGMKRVMAKGFLYQYHVLLPATVGIILLAVPFARLFDYSDNFTVKDTMLTAWALAFYAAGMVGWAGRDLLTRASYALENTRTPVIVSLISFLVYLPCALVLMRQLDHGGLALAYSLVSFLNMALQAVMLRKQIGRLFDRTFYASLGKGAAASAVMAAVIWAVSALAVRLSGAESLPLHGEAVDALASLPALPGGWLGAVWLAGIVALAAAAYAGVLVAMKDDTAAELLARFIPRRFQIGRRDKEVD